MTLLAIQYLFKFEYRCSPEKLQLYKAIIMCGMFSKFPIGVLIDSKVKTRRIYCIITNIVITLLNFAVAFKILDTPESVCLSQFLITFVLVFID